MSSLAEVCKGSDPPKPLTSLSNKPLACLASSGLMKSILNREKSFIVTPMPNTKSYSNCLLEPIVTWVRFPAQEPTPQVGTKVLPKSKAHLR